MLHWEWCEQPLSKSPALFLWVLVVVWALVSHSLLSGFLYSARFPLDSRKAFFISATNLSTTGNILYVVAPTRLMLWLYVRHAVSYQSRHIFKRNTIRGESFHYGSAFTSSGNVTSTRTSRTKTLLGAALTNSTFSADFGLSSVVSSTTTETVTPLNIFFGSNKPGSLLRKGTDKGRSLRLRH